MEQKIIIEDKNKENNLSIDGLENAVKESQDNKRENLLIKEQNEKENNIFRELLDKISECIEEKTEKK